MKIQRLNATHYDALLSLLNTVFSVKNGREMNFEEELPAMCVRDDAHMERQFGIFEDGTLVAAMGVYPFDVVVAGEVLRFATTGNIAVKRECEGKGYMSALMEYAMKELDRLGIDVARLGGLRSRYNRYGFESAGQNYSFTFTEKNRLRGFPLFAENVTFEKIGADDEQALAFAASLYNKNGLAKTRTAANAYPSMTAWRCTPYVAVKNGERIGYLCAKPNEAGITELCGTDTNAVGDIVCAWQARVGAPIYFYRQMHEIADVRLFSRVCENVSVSAPSHFKIRSWAKTIDAFLKLKASYLSLLHGELRIKIEGAGTFLLFVDENGVGCRPTSEAPDVTLDVLSATRYIFGALPSVCTADAPSLAQAWFPLPLSWNPQDRI